jgi:hypothetical protein
MRTAVLCGSTSTEWVQVGDRLIHFSTDTHDLAWNLIHEFPEAIVAYDRIYLWDWQYEDLYQLTADRRFYECEVIQELISTGVLAPLTWPIKDADPASALHQFSSFIADNVSDRLGYHLADDFFVLMGLVEELESAQRAKRTPLVVRDTQVEWVEEISDLLRRRSQTRHLLRLWIEDQRAGFGDAVDEQISALEGNFDLLTRRRVRLPTFRKKYLDTFTALIPEFELVSYREQGERYTDLDLVFEWRASMVEFRREVSRIAEQAEGLTPTDSDRIAWCRVVERVLESHCKLVEEALLDSFPATRTFCRILTGNTLAFFTDLAVAGGLLVAGLPVPTPGASMIPAVLGGHLRHRSIRRALKRETKFPHATWYREWLDWKTSFKFDRKQGIWIALKPRD